MGETDDKGFVVKDRRKISIDDMDQEVRSSGDQEAVKPESAEAAKGEPEAPRGDGEAEGVPLPEVSFSTFVFSLSSSALVHLGEVPEPTTSRTRTDLPMAKQIIDTLGMLEEKTRGNLNADEEQLLRTVLYDLRMRYVQKSAS